MTQTLNPEHHPANRDSIASHLIPVWYANERSNLISDLTHVTKAAITADGWTSFVPDHCLTVTLRYVREGQNKDRVLNTNLVNGNTHSYTNDRLLSQPAH